MPDNTVVPGLYQLLNSLEEEDPESLKDCECTTKRQSLLDRFDVPYPNGSPGFNLLKYEQGNNFNTFIQQIINGSKQVLVGTPAEEPFGDRQAIQPWVTTEFFDFLYTLTQDAALLQSLRDGTPDQRQQILVAHLQHNAYGEREAIQQILANPTKDEAFSTAVNKISTTFQNQFRFCC